MRLLFFLLVCFSLQGQGVVDRFTKFAGEDPILALTPDFYANTTSIVSADTSEGTEITEWSNLAQASPDGVAGVTPEVHVGTAGAAVQVSFNGSDDYLNLGQTLQYDPNADEAAWFVIRAGDAIDTAGAILSQATSSISTSAFRFYNSGGTFFVVLGGGSYATAFELAANDLLIVNVESDGVSSFDIHLNGTETDSNKTANGTANNAADINIGGRTNGSFLWGGDVDIIAFKFGATLSQGQIDAIFAAYQVNALWWLLLIAPTFFKRKLVA